MNAILDSRAVVKNLLCAAVALLITVMTVWSFMDRADGPTTGNDLLQLTSLQIPLDHQVFGRPEPAVLVD
jgi:hypothetical protein